MTPSLRRIVHHLQKPLVPLAMLVALATLAATLADAQAAAETAYLAMLATAVLLPLSMLPGRTPYAVEATALLMAVLAWVLPAGATRGAAAGVLLTACVVVELAGQFGRRRDRLPWEVAFGVAIALQMLIRADRLLAPAADLPTAIALLGLPLAAGAAAVFLWPAYRRQTLLAVAVLVAAAPGFRVAPVLALLAFAAAVNARRWPRTALAALSLVLFAAAFWRPPFAVLLALAVLPVLVTDRRRVPVAVAAVAAVAAIVPLAPVSWAAAGPGLAPLLFLLPTLPALERRHAPRIAAAALLAVAGLRWLPEEIAALAPALVLAALHLTTRQPLRRLQRLWGGTLAAGACLLASYPWLRARPLDDLMGWLSRSPDWRFALLWAAAFLAFGLLAASLKSRRPAWAPRPEPIALGLLAIAVYAALPHATARPVAGEPFVLDAANPRWEVELDLAVSVSELVIDSYLSNGIEVPPGTVVARATTVSPDGETLQWPLRAGIDTGEWAARRPDVAALPGLTTPPAWLSWVAPGDFFAQRYRARLQHPPSQTRRLRIELGPELPPSVSMAVFQIELRR